MSMAGTRLVVGLDMSSRLVTERASLPEWMQASTALSAQVCTHPLILPSLYMATCLDGLYVCCRGQQHHQCCHEHGHHHHDPIRQRIILVVTRW